MERVSNTLESRWAKEKMEETLATVSSWWRIFLVAIYLYGWESWCIERHFSHILYPANKRRHEIFRSISRLGFLFMNLTRLCSHNSKQFSIIRFLQTHDMVCDFWNINTIWKYDNWNGTTIVSFYLVTVHLLFFFLQL